MDEYATVPQNIPSNAVVEQLDPINLGGNRYHGWKMLFTKSVDTGKKDKQTKQEIITQEVDNSKAPKYDDKTALYMRDTKLADANKQITQFAMSLQYQLAKSSMNKGGNK